MWDKGKLTDLAKERREALSDVQGALLAFARVKELTDENGIDGNRAKKDLETAFDNLGPEAADRLRTLGSIQRDEVLRDFLMELTDHNQRRIDRDLEEVVAMSKDRKNEAPDDDDDGEDSPRRKRGLSR